VYYINVHISRDILQYIVENCWNDKKEGANKIFRVVWLWMLHLMRFLIQIGPFNSKKLMSAYDKTAYRPFAPCVPTLLRYQPFKYTPLNTACQKRGSHPRILFTKKEGFTHIHLHHVLWLTYQNNLNHCRNLMRQRRIIWKKYAADLGLRDPCMMIRGVSAQ